MTGQETHNKLTDYWREHDIKEGQEFAILTNIIHQGWSSLKVQGHKAIKGLKSQKLRDHMSEAELIFTALAELSTRQIAERHDATGMPENKAQRKPVAALPAAHVRRWKTKPASLWSRATTICRQHAPRP
jgi:DNA-damage-inducible protein D